MGGPAEVALDKLVDDFNKSQNKYEAIPQYQGAYDEAVQKIIQSHGTSASPALFQSFDISTAQMMHSKYTTPVQKFIDEDNYDVSDISPVAHCFTQTRVSSWPCRLIRHNRCYTTTHHCSKSMV